MSISSHADTRIKTATSIHRIVSFEIFSTIEVLSGVAFQLHIKMEPYIFMQTYYLLPLAYLDSLLSTVDEWTTVLDTRPHVKEDLHRFTTI